MRDRGRGCKGSMRVFGVLGVGTLTVFLAAQDPKAHLVKRVQQPLSHGACGPTPEAAEGASRPLPRRQQAPLKDDDVKVGVGRFQNFR